MITDNKRFNRAIALMAVMIVLSIELPYSDKAIIQHIILFFSSKFTDTASLTVRLFWGIPLLIGWIWAFIQIVRSKKFGVNGIIIFLVMFVILIPITEDLTDHLRSIVYKFDEGIGSVEIIDSSLYIYDDSFESNILEKEYSASLEVDLIYHNEINDDLQIRLTLPEMLNDYFEETSFLMDLDINSFNDGVAIFRCRVNLDLIENYDPKLLSKFDIKNLDYTLELIGENEARFVIRNDMY